MSKETKTNPLLQRLRKGEELTMRQRLELTAQLSVPAILAQFSVIAMQYIDASMVGSLGAEASASIGLISTTTWLFGGVCSAVAMGFSVQVAHRIGANDEKGARSVLRQSIVAVGLFGILLSVVGLLISGGLPEWLGGNEAINGNASTYFMLFSLALPIFLINFLAGNMLRCAGNMRIPSILNVLMCVMDVIFNALLIFPTHHYDVTGIIISIPGAGMGVAGAAIGTGLAELVTAILMMYYLCNRQPELSIIGEQGSYRPRRECIRRAMQIGLPMGGEHIVFCGAQILATMIVAPLGTVAIAANAFAITAESLCYMPGYGIAEAATTLVGQSLGAKRLDMTRHFANITVWMGIVVMTVMAVVMYVAAPLMMEIMTPDEAVQAMGVMALRTEAYAEPMFAASIVAYGVFVGAGDTLKPAIMNLFSIWAVRLSLAATLAPTLGLQGVWIAMCAELCFRGVIFLVRLYRGKWMNRV